MNYLLCLDKGHFITGGKRHLWCKNQEYDLSAGDLILFDPKDNHYCAPINEETLDYRALNIKADIMINAVKEITGKDYLPHFTQNVIYNSDIAMLIKGLYNKILTHAPQFEKEEAFFLLLEQILQEYAVPFCEIDLPKQDDQIQVLCTYMEEHFTENIRLDELTAMIFFSKSYLLSCFTKQVGVSPYRYLQNVRLNYSKKLLEQGVSPIEAAMIYGFADQSHFTNFFKEFIGLTPKQYQRIFVNKIKENNNED